MTSSEPLEQRERRSTGLPGLDKVVHGGLLTGSVYIIRGTPGAGKTIMASQMCFHWASQGEQCLYVTLLSESHDRLISNLQRLNFYSSELIDRIHYQSGFHTLEEEGLKGILRLLMNETKRYDSCLIVLDGLFALQERVGSEREFRLFMNQLQNLAHLSGSTMLLLTNSERGECSPEYTMVDGWLEIAVQQREYLVSRYVQVHKLRGSGFISGKHSLTISDDGVDILPRLESLASQYSLPPCGEERLSTGIAEFDAMISGGLRRGSNTLVLGATGVGKTAFGLHFIAESSAQEPGLIFGFYEGREDLIEKANALGISGLAEGVNAGTIRMIWHAAGDHLLDELAYNLIDTIREHGIKRLFLDGIDPLKQGALHPGRFSKFLSALTNILRHEDVTAVFTLETPELIGGETGVPLNVVSAIAQNIVLLRYEELESQTFRTIGVVKARTSPFDPRLRQFSITDKGIRIGEGLNKTVELLAERAHPHRREGSGSDE